MMDEIESNGKYNTKLYEHIKKLKRKKTKFGKII